MSSHGQGHSLVRITHKVTEIVPVDLSYPRNQVTTQSTLKFSELRAHIFGSAQAREQGGTHTN
jgi:hypothetical protein